MSKITAHVMALLPLVAGLAWMTLPASAQGGGTNGEWRYCGADSGSTKYTPLDQINKDNF